MELSELRTYNDSWLRIAGAVDSDRAKNIFGQVEAKVAAGEFSWDEVAYVSKVTMSASAGALHLNEEQLEKIRRACQLWDVDIRLKEITSHRPVIGPIIVQLKRLIYPILQAFLKDFVRQQRSFNAAVLAMLVDVYGSQLQSADSSAHSHQSDQGEIER